MKTKLLFTFLFLGITLLVFSQDDSKNENGWTKTGSVGINFSQVSLTNWSAGGSSSIAGNMYLNGGVNYKKDRWLWQNALNLEYGWTSIKSEGVKKSADKISFNTQLGYSTDNIWYYTALASFQSQFSEGYNYPEKEHYISKFMAPGYVNASVGMEYRPENKWYSIYMSPIAGRFIFVKDKYLSDLGNLGVDKGKEFKAELGIYLKGKAEKTIMENVKLITDAVFYTPYDKSFGNVDVEWNLLINMKINKYLNASVNTTLKYYDKVKYIDEKGVHGPRVQFKEIIGVGLGYNF